MGLIKLAEGLGGNDNTRLIKLPSAGFFPDDKPFFVTGWGASTDSADGSTTLQRTDATIVDYDLCKQSNDKVAGKYPDWELALDAENICAGYYDEGGKGGMYFIFIVI